MAVSQSLAVTQQSQSIENNNSTVRIVWKSTQSGASYNNYNRTAYYYVSVNGGTEKKYSVAYTLPKGSTKTVVDTTLVVPHNDNGECSVTVRTWMDTDISAGVVELSKTLTLDTIARKSTLSASNGTLNTEQTLTVTRKSSGYTHTVTYKCGSASGTICTKSSNTSIAWTPPLSLASQNTTGTSVSITFTIETFNGSTSIGTNTKTITCSIPSSVKPSCTLTVTDSTGYEDTYGNPIKGKSKFKVVIEAETAYGSPIASYSTTANGNTYTDSEFTTGVLKSSGDVSVDTTVKDKRGRTCTASVTKTILNYTRPKIFSVSVKRCDSDGTENISGEYVSISFSSGVTSLADNNHATYKVRYKKSSETTWTVTTLSDLADNYDVSGYSKIISMSSDYTYDIEISVQDDFETYTAATSVSSGFAIMHFLKTGLGLAIGKIAELANYLDVGWNAIFRKTVEIVDTLTVQGKINGVTIEDSGWITPDYDSDTADPTAGTKLKYRKINGIVYIQGTIGITNKESGVTHEIFTLPEGYRPSQVTYSTNTATGAKMARWYASYSGIVAVEWVRNLSDGSEVTGKIGWLGIDCSFPVD